MIALVTAGRWLLSNWRVVGAALALAGAAYGGYHMRDVRAREQIAAIHAEYAANAAKQAIAALNVAKAQERANEDLAKKHAADAARVRAYYERRMRERPATVPAVPTVPVGAGSPDAAASEPGVAGSCEAELLEVEESATLDALTIIEWQEWYETQRRNHAGAAR